MSLVQQALSPESPIALKRRTSLIAREERPIPVKLQVRARTAADVASRFAEQVDAAARFPREAVDALREQRLLGAMIPTALGGEGASMTDIAGVCHRLGAACSATAMIYAMHQVKVACLLRHGQGNSWRDAHLRRLAEQQWLLASSTTEGTGGGDIRSSDAAIVRTRAGFTYSRNASVISYGEYADGIVTTARRAPDAAASDQVLVWLLRDDYRMDVQGGWDTLGMRGTCSRGFRVEASGVADQILDVPYARIHAYTMMPAAHLLWASAWTGIAAASVERARLFLRHAMSQSDGKSPPGAAHFTQARRSLSAIMSQVRAALHTFEQVSQDDRALSSLDLQTTLNLLKVDVSEGTVATIMSAMRACGLSGYRNDTPYSQGRLLRDALSTPLMINNERILQGIGTTALLAQTPALVPT